MSSMVTHEVHGQRIRLIDFDAPELEGHAHCGLERMLAARATSRSRQMIQRSTDIDLQIVDCSCRPGTEGTRGRNFGRACGYLTVDGQLRVRALLVPQTQAVVPI
jgi:hypothetical protein